MKLTDTFLRNLKPDGQVKKYSDGSGLFLHVSESGGKLWRLAYRYNGRQKLLSFGAYPTVSLKDARKRRDDAKELLARDVDPSLHKQAVKAARLSEEADTFEIIAREWYAKHSPTLVESHAKKILSRLEKQLFPFLGALNIRMVDASHILRAVQHAERRQPQRDIMRVNKILLFALLTTLVLPFTGCDKKEETKTVDWYMAPENKDALETKLKECRNNPGELKDTPNCQNAALAQHKLFARKPPTPIKF